MWERRRVTVVFVTHDLAEAIVLGQRVVVMSRRPGRVKAIRDISVPAPRDPFDLRGSPEFTRLEASIWTELRDEFRAVTA
jgi:ABC-type nitrate/sulfonate/bicarbonate transport system ATPase subunit